MSKKHHIHSSNCLGNLKIAYVQHWMFLVIAMPGLWLLILFALRLLPEKPANLSHAVAQLQSPQPVTRATIATCGISSANWPFVRDDHCQLTWEHKAILETLTEISRSASQWDLPAVAFLS